MSTLWQIVGLNGGIMSKVNYRKCDICGEILKTDIRDCGFVNGYRIWNRLFNKLDICRSCMKKIERLSDDVKDEEKYVNELFENHGAYEDSGCESAYLQGAEDMLGILSHKRLRNVKRFRE